MKLLSTGEVAEKLQVTQSTALKWIKRGLFPNAEQTSIKTGTGSVWLIPESDLENFRKPKRGKPFTENPSPTALAKRRSRSNYKR